MTKKLIVITAVIFVIFSFSLVFFWLQSFQDKERILLQGFVRKNLKKEYYSFPLDIKHKLIPSGETTGSDNVHGVSWKNNGNTIYSALYYNQNDSQVLEYMTSITLAEPLENFDETNALSIAKTYFNYVGEHWNCRDLIADNPEIGILCESFWEGTDKNKYGVGTISAEDQTIVYICEFPIGSEVYDKESCVDITIK